MNDTPQIPEPAHPGEGDRGGRASIAALDRWEAFGGHWRTKSLTATEATVELLTCCGTPEDELRSGEPSLLAFLACHPCSGGEPEA